MRVKLVASFIVAVVALSLPVGAAFAEPPSGGFGPAIDGGGYEGQSRCSPYAKPGVLAFRSVVLRAYPGTGMGGIERACTVGGQSEHKEGRAWDWTVNVGIPYQRQAAESLLDWLTKEDRYGNDAAMAKRLGIMYIIWNRRIWGGWSGDWETYCVPKPYGCKEPGRGGGLRHPHTDHVHFSFTWDGAMKRTTYWHKKMSLLGGAASSPYGYWLFGNNGAVVPFNTYYYGSQAERGAAKQPVVDMASRPTGDGYWLLSANGRVKAYGDAPFKGAPKGETKKAAGIVSTPTGKGYWIYARGGQVFAYGDADTYGGLGGDGAIVKGLAPTIAGLGYWLVTESGRVEPFGDAQFYGGAANEVSGVEGIVASATGLGYWLYTRGGRVLPYGDAVDLGGLGDKKLNQSIVELTRTATGTGYWLVGDKGLVKGFGEAPKLGSLASRSFRPSPPAGLVPQVMPGD